MSRSATSADAADTARLLHELHVHQIELEQQNEHLRQAREEVEAERDRYAELYDSAPVAYFTLDSDGCIARLNPAAAALVGGQPQAIAEQRLADFIAAGSAGGYRDFLGRLVFQNANETAELELRRADGGTRWVRFEGRLAASGTEFHIAAADITERRLAERALVEARDAAERANRAKSSFLANMSHEMRTPLHIVVGLARMLHRDIADPAQQQRLDQLCVNSDHLLALINDVLDLSRIEAGRLELDSCDFRLGTMIERVLDVIAAPARAKGLTLTVDIAPSLSDATVRGDPLRLVQVLINLGTNAVKFTESGSVRLVIGGDAEGGGVLNLSFSVQDSGIGMTAADQARLFGAFTQLDSSAARAYGGSGLGLVISQRLVELMGGRIAVQSSPGMGSCFSFELALPRGASLPESAELSAQRAFGGRRVLFAEDHLLSQEILLEMLEDLGCDVDVASDGVEALAAARERDFDLILMDMQMPKMDGLEATRAIRALERHRATPIVALTANAFVEDRERCFAAGMNGYLGKPVTPETLAAMLAQWLPAPDVPEESAAVADDATEGELRQTLAAIPQLDPACPFRRSTRSLAEYCTLLHRYVDAHEHDIVRVRENLAAGQRDAARSLVHDLIGISGIVGASQVAARAADLHVALRAGREDRELAPLVATCAAELTSLAAAVRGLPRAAD